MACRLKSSTACLCCHHIVIGCLHVNSSCVEGERGRGQIELVFGEDGAEGGGGGDPM